MLNRNPGRARKRSRLGGGESEKMLKTGKVRLWYPALNLPLPEARVNSLQAVSIEPPATAAAFPYWLRSAIKTLDVPAWRKGRA